jgi:fructose-bisphosphate aldolase class I
MNAQELMDTARALVAGDKRFASSGSPQTEEARRAYRELIVTAPGLGRCISGMILYDAFIEDHILILAPKSATEIVGVTNCAD